MIRFIMAIVFKFIISPRLTVKKLQPKMVPAETSTAFGAGNKRRYTKSNIAPSNYGNIGASNNDNRRKSIIPRQSRFSMADNSIMLQSYLPAPSSNIVDDRTILVEQDPYTLYSMCLVTCYSEGEESIRNTLDALARTTYSEKHKVIILIADGIIKGSGEKKSTPEICESLIDVAEWCYPVQPMSYVAVAEGSKQHNMAKVVNLLSFHISPLNRIK